MKNLNFPLIQEEIHISFFSPANFLKEFATTLATSTIDFSIEEKLVLIVLDRDGYFYSETKPEPILLFKLHQCGIFVHAFMLFKGEKKVYTCFSKIFIELNPDFKPTLIFNK